MTSLIQRVVWLLLLPLLVLLPSVAGFVMVGALAVAIGAVVGAAYCWPGLVCLVPVVLPVLAVYLLFQHPSREADC
jgi:hypothetical protein